MVALTFILANNMLPGGGGPVRALTTWQAFIKRPDIRATIVLTAIVTVLFVYWQRDRRRK